MKLHTTSVSNNYHSAVFCVYSSDHLAVERAAYHIYMYVCVFRSVSRVNKVNENVS